MLPPSQPDENQANDAMASQTGGNSKREASGRTWAFALVAALVAGFGSWWMTESVLGFYRSALMPPMKAIPTEADARGITLARITTGSIAYGGLGGLLGLALGMAGGGSRGSARASGSAGVVGLVLGMVGTGVGARLILPVFFAQFDPQSSDLLVPLLTHMAIWCVAGAAGSVAFGLGAGCQSHWTRSALGGFLGVAAATVAYELIGALGFPTSQTQMPMATSPATRGLAQILVAIGAAIGSVLATGEPAKRPVPAKLVSDPK